MNTFQVASSNVRINRWNPNAEKRDNKVKKDHAIPFFSSGRISLQSSPYEIAPVLQSIRSI